MKPFVKPSLIQKLTQTTRGLKRDTSGNVAIMTAVMSAIFIGGLAIAIDTAQAHFAKERLQATTDSIALLAVKDDLTSKSDLTAAAQAYLDFSYPSEQGARIELIDIKRDGDTVRLSARNNIDATFARIWGKDNMNVSVVSEATYAETPLEIALVLDTTGSMRGAKIQALKTAATDLVDKIEENGGKKVKISVVPFAQYVNVGTNQKNANWIVDSNQFGWQGCVGSRTGGYDERPEYSGLRIPAVTGNLCGAEIQPMTKKLSDVKSTINSMQARGWTYMPSGLIWGWRTLEPSAPFPNNAKAGTKKVLVLMTDGTNTRSKSGELHQGENTRDANDKTADLCAAIKDDDISVYSIAYEINNVTTRNLVSDCASSRQQFFNATSTQELKDAFDEIGTSVTKLRLTS